MDWGGTEFMKSQCKYYLETQEASCQTNPSTAIFETLYTQFKSWNLKTTKQEQERDRGKTLAERAKRRDKKASEKP